MSRVHGLRHDPPDPAGPVAAAGSRSTTRAEVVTEDDRWRLEDERDFLVRSIEDAEREHQAGDLSTADLRVLRKRDGTKLDEVERAIAALDGLRTFAEPDGPGALEGTEPENAGNTEDTGGGAGQRPERHDRPERHGRSKRRRLRLGGRRRWWFAGVGAAAMIAGAVVLVINLTSPQLPGQSISGSVPLNSAQQIQRELAQASVLTGEGTASSISEALIVYRRILTQDPNQPQALAETGWLEWSAGAVSNQPSLVAEGKALVQQSLKVKADDYAAHLYLGTILLKQGNDAADAVAQYQLFLAEDPPAADVTNAAPLIRQAFAAAGQPLPAGVPSS